MKKLISLLLLCFVTAISFAQETVTVSPNLGEAFKYAHKTGQTIWTVIGVFLLIVAVFYVIAGNLGKLHYDNKVTFVILALGLASILSKPLAIRWNNDKTVTKAYYDKVGRDYILDSCFKNNLMIDAAVKK